MNDFQESMKSVENAIVIQDLALLDKLLSAEPELTHQCIDEGLRSWMHMAVGMMNTEIIALLARKGADANLLNSEKRPPLYYALHVLESSWIVQELLKAGADLNSEHNLPPQYTGKTILHVVILKRHANIFLQMLLAHGANPMALDDEGKTPLLLAAEIGDKRASLMLADYGADPAYRSRDGQPSALEAAEAAGHVDLADELRVRVQAKQAHQMIRSIAELQGPMLGGNRLRRLPS